MNNDSNTADNIRRTNIGNDKFVRTFLGELQANFSAREEARCRKVAIFPPTPLALAYSTVPNTIFFLGRLSESADRTRLFPILPVVGKIFPLANDKIRAL
jgi:hypothetical protein